MLRCIVCRIFRDGRLLLVNKRKIHTKIWENSRKKKQNNTKRDDFQLVEASKRGAIVRIGAQARRLLVDNFQNTKSCSSEANSENIKRLFYGSRFPLFAFVSVGMATSGTGFVTKDEELEGLCWEIRDTVVKVQQNRSAINKILENVSLEDLEIGPSIGKGCSGVIYAVALKSELKPVDNLKNIDDLGRFPLALKMMFNYDIQSNALLILRAMYRETIPARQSQLSVAETALMPGQLKLPAHANIVSMFSAFCAEIPNLENADQLYPMALPRRLYAEGHGRNMSMFLLMKRYNYSLEKYLQRRESKTISRIALILFAQLLEAVAHLHRYGIAHRDLKSDNILIEKDEESSMPILVLTDFGCCLADKQNGFQVPYRTNDVDKGGNAALMAPEIITKKPDRFAVLDYSKSDIWAAGTIAYEIFGEKNPFLGSKGEESQLKNHNYNDDDLPMLAEEVPWIVQKLIANMLRRNPKQRLNPDVAANVMQLFLWAPSAWLRPAANIPSSDDIVDWLFCLTTKVLCENVFSETAKRTDALTEYLLISSFLQRASLSRIKQALIWIQTISRPF